MGLDLGCHSFVHALDTDTTSQIMHGDGQNEYDHECGEHPAGQKVQKRHAEDVEADVFDRTEGRSAPKSTLLVNSSQLRHCEAAPAPMLMAKSPVTANRTSPHRDPMTSRKRITASSSGLASRYWGAKRSASHRFVQHNTENKDNEDQRKNDLGRQHLAPHIAVTNGVEPEVVGYEVRDAAHRQQQSEESNDYEGQKTPRFTTDR